MPEWTLVNILAQFGLSGAIIAIAVTAAFWFIKLLQESHTARLQDLQKLNETTQDLTLALQAATRAQEDRNRAVEAMSQAQQQLARTVENAHNQNTQKIDQLIRDVAYLTARDRDHP